MRVIITRLPIIMLISTSDNSAYDNRGMCRKCGLSLPVTWLASNATYMVGSQILIEGPTALLVLYQKHTFWTSRAYFLMMMKGKGGKKDKFCVRVVCSSVFFKTYLYEVGMGSKFMGGSFFSLFFSSFDLVLKRRTSLPPRGTPKKWTKKKFCFISQNCYVIKCPV
jgi:hypothetical protein